MKVLFYLFDFPIYFFGFMIGIGIIAGIFISYLEIKRKRLDADAGLDVVLFSFLAAIAGARLFYILFYDLTYYMKNPAEIILINEGGLSIHGGLISAFIIAFIYTRKNRINFLKYADAFAPGLILGQAIGRIGCDVFGKIMNSPLPWGIEHQGLPVHPTQAYEFLLDYLAFFILWSKRKNQSYDGQIFVWYLFMFSFNRTVVEFYRTNPMIGSLVSVSHALSLILVLSALFLMAYAKKRRTDMIPDNSGNAIGRKTEWMINLIIVTVLAVISLFIYYSVQG